MLKLGKIMKKNLFLTPQLPYSLICGGVIKSLFFTDKDKPVINLKTKEHLLHIYKPDIIKLESLISRDLSSWHTKING